MGRHRSIWHYKSGQLACRNLFIYPLPTDRTSSHCLTGRVGGKLQPSCCRPIYILTDLVHALSAVPDVGLLSHCWPTRLEILGPHKWVPHSQNFLRFAQLIQERKKKDKAWRGCSLCDKGSLSDCDHWEVDWNPIRRFLRKDFFIFFKSLNWMYWVRSLVLDLLLQHQIIETSSQKGTSNSSSTLVNSWRPVLI